MKIKKPHYDGFYPSLYGDTVFEAWYNEVCEPINKMLSEGVEVCGYVTEDHVSMHENHNAGSSDTHKALLINIEPIKQDSVEQFLKDIIQDENIESIGSLRSRAKKLLEGKDEK